MQTHIEYCFG